MRELLTLVLPTAGRAARAVAVERYGWDRTFGELLGLYEELVSGGRDVVGAARMALVPPLRIAERGTGGEDSQAPSREFTRE